MVAFHPSPSPTELICRQIQTKSVDGTQSQKKSKVSRNENIRGDSVQDLLFGTYDTPQLVNLQLFRKFFMEKHGKKFCSWNRKEWHIFQHVLVFYVLGDINPQGAFL